MGGKWSGLWRTFKKQRGVLLGGISMPPGPPESHLPQRLHPGPHKSHGLQALCLGKCSYRAAGNFLYEVTLAPWGLDVCCPESHPLGGHCGPGKVGPGKASQADPTGSLLWFSGPKEERWWLLEHLPREWDIKEIELLCSVEGIVLCFAMPVPFLFKGYSKFVHSTNILWAPTTVPAIQPDMVPALLELVYRCFGGRLPPKESRRKRECGCIPF